MGEEEEDTPLAAAVKDNDLKEVQQLLKAGEDPNALDALGETPLFEATSAGSADIVGALLAHSADPSIQSPAGMVARELAMEAPIKTLLDLFQGKEVGADAERASLDALAAGVRGDVEAQLAKRRAGPSSEAKGQQAPVGDLDAKAPPPAPPPAVAAAADEAAKPAGGAQTFSMADDSDEDLEVVGGGAPDQDDQVAPLLKAVQLANLADVLRLLKAGADANLGDDMGETPLFEAAVGGDADIAAALLLHKADPLWKSTADMTPIQLAEDATIKVLLKMFSGESVASAEKFTALQALNPDMRASVEKCLAQEDAEAGVGEGKPAEAEQAQPAGAAEASPPKADAAAKAPPAEGGSAKPEAAEEAEEDQESPLLLAVQQANLKEVLRLLEGRANPNLGDAMGETPLFEAAAGGEADIAAALLLHSADPDWRSSAELSPIELAEDSAMKALLKLFSGSGVVQPSASEAALKALSTPMRRRVDQHLAAKRPAQDADAEAVASTEKEVAPPADQQQNASKDAAAAAPVAEEKPPVQEPPQQEAAAPAAEEDPPLVVAVQGGDLREVLKLLEGRADPNLGDAMGETPLFEAAAGGDTNVAAALLVHSADPDQRSSADMTPVQLADDDAMKAVLQLFSGAADPSTKAAALEALIPSMQQKVEEALAAKSPAEAPEAAAPSPSEQKSDEPPEEQPADSQEAAAPAPAEPPKQEAKEHSDEQQDADAAAKAASADDEPEKKEVEHEADSQKESPAPAAAPAEQLEEPEREQGAQGQEEQESPLLVAVQGADLQEVMRLLEGRADPNLGDAVGETPFFEAAVGGEPNIVAALLLHNADPCRRSAADISPMELVDDIDTKALLTLFSGGEVKSLAKEAALEALDESMREKVEQHLAAKNPAQEETPVVVPSEDAPAAPAPAAAEQAELQEDEEAAAPNAEAEPEKADEQEPGDSKEVPASEASPAEEPPKTEAAPSAGEQQEQDPPLLVAVQVADVKEVLRLLEGRADPNIGDAMGETPLFEAAAGGSADVTAALLLHSADLGCRSSADMTPVQLADDEAVKALMQLFGEGEVEDSAKTLALEALSPQLRKMVEEHIAAKHPAPEVATKEPPAEEPAPAEPEPPTESPAAPEEASTESVAPTDEADKPPQQEAADDASCSGEKETEQAAAKEPEKLAADEEAQTSEAQDGPPKKEPEKEGESKQEEGQEVSLLEAVQQSKLPEVLRLLEGRADPNLGDEVGETPLFEAAVGGDANIAAALLVHSANPSHRSTADMTPIQLADDGGVKALLGLFAGEDTEPSARSAALEALSAPMRERVEEKLAARLPEAKAAPPAEEAEAAAPSPAEQEPTPASEKAAGDAEEAPEDAEATGAGPAEEETAPQAVPTEEAPLAAAAQEEEEEEEEEETAAAAPDETAKGEASPKDSPLLQAVQSASLQDVLRLLEGRADPNLGDPMGETPLFEAAAAGDVNVAAALLLHSADPGMRSSADMMPMQLAADDAMKALLELFGKSEADAATKTAALEALDASMRTRVEEHMAAKHPAAKDVEVPAASDDTEEVRPSAEEQSAQDQQESAAAPADKAPEPEEHDSEPDDKEPAAAAAGAAPEAEQEAEAEQEPAAAAGTAQEEPTEPKEEEAGEQKEPAAAAATAQEEPTEPKEEEAGEQKAAAAATAAAEQPAAPEAEKADAKEAAVEEPAAPPQSAEAESQEASTAAPSAADEPAAPSEPEKAAAKEEPAPSVAAEHDTPAAKEAPDAAASGAEEPAPPAPKEEAEPQKKEDSPLLLAVQSADVQEVLRLLAGRADPNVGDSTGETPLFEAVAVGNTDMAAALLLHSADPEWRSDSDMQPIQLAEDDAMKALLGLFNGAPPDQAGKDMALQALTPPVRRRVMKHLATKRAKAAAATPPATPSRQQTESPKDGTKEASPPPETPAPAVEAAPAPAAADPAEAAAAEEAPAAQSEPEPAEAPAGAVSAAAQEQAEDPPQPAAAEGPAAAAEAPAEPPAEAELAAAAEPQAEEPPAAEPAAAEPAAPEPAAAAEPEAAEPEAAEPEAAEPEAAEPEAPEPEAAEPEAAEPEAAEPEAAEPEAPEPEAAEPSQPPIEEETEAAAATSGERAAPLAPSADEAEPSPAAVAEPPAEPVANGPASEAEPAPAPNGEAAAEEAADAAASLPSSQEPPLSVAVQNVDVQEVLRLLEEGHDPNRGDATGETPLFEVAAGGHMDLAAELLLHGADPEQRSSTGMKPAELAAESAMQTLLGLFSTGEVESSAKALAMEALSPPVRERVQKHLAAKYPAPEEPPTEAPPDEKPEPSASKPEEAAPPAAEIPAPTLTKAPPQLDEDEDPPLTIAVQHQDLPEVVRLLKEGHDPNRGDRMGDTPLFEAAANGNLKMAAELLLHGAQAEYRSPAGMQAIDFADDDAMQALIELFGSGEVVAAVRKTALEALPEPIRERVQRHISASTGKGAEVVASDSPVAAPSDGEVKSKEAVVLAAAQEGNVKEVIRLLHEGHDPNLGDDLGETAIFEAAASDSLQMATELLLHGAEVDRRSTSGGVPVDLTSSDAMKTLFELFAGRAVDAPAKNAALQALEAPLRERVIAHLSIRKPSPEAAEPEAPAPTPKVAASQEGEAELTLAVQSNDLQWVSRLLRDGADVNVADAMGETPLFEAASGDNLDMAATLLLARADANHLSRGNVRAQELAATASMKTLLELFRGVKVSANDRSALAEGLSPQTWSTILAKLDDEVPQEAPAAANGGDASEEGPPLMVAARAGNLEEVRELLDAGHDPNKGDAVGETALFEAVFADNADIAAALLLKKADPSQRSLSDAEPIDFVAGPAMKNLLGIFKGKDLDGLEEVAFKALSSGIRKEVKDYLEDFTAKAAIRQALRKEEPEKEVRVDKLPAPAMRSSDESRRASQLRREEWKPVGSATMNGKDHSDGAMENGSGGVAANEGALPVVSKLATAVRRDNVPEVMALLESGTDANIRNADGETALFDAVRRGNADTVAALMMFSADLCMVSHEGHTARKWANASMDKILDFFQGIHGHSGITDLSCLSSLSQKMRQTAIRWVQDQDQSANQAEMELDMDQAAPVNNAASKSPPQPVPAAAMRTPSKQEAITPRRAQTNGASVPSLSRGASGISAGCVSVARAQSATSFADHRSCMDPSANDRIAELEMLLHREHAAREASERRLAALEARVAATEALLLQPPRSLLGPSARPGCQEPAHLRPAVPPAAAPGATSSAAPATAAVQRYEVMHGPFVATRKAPSMRSERACRLPRGTILTLAEWNASREWRRIVEVPGGLSEGVDSWVPVNHSIWGPLLRPVDVPNAPAFLEKLADWRSVVQAACCDADDGAWYRGELPSKELDMQQARRLLSSLGRSGGHQAVDGAGRSPAADALLGIFRGEAVAEDAERRKALAGLDPDTVRIVLSAALQHLQDNGANVQVRHIAPAAETVAQA